MTLKAKFYGKAAIRASQAELILRRFAKFLWRKYGDAIRTA